MRIVVTGAGGFVGRRLVAMLAGHDVVAVDVRKDGIPVSPRVQAIGGDLADPAVLAAAFGEGCDAVVHLATVPGGAAEENPARAKRVNVDATIALVDAAARAGRRPRFVFASSIAVFGAPLPSSVDDATPVLPKLLYGAHKAMMEQWIATLSRRGAIDGISLRLPGVVARPRGPSGMKSAFLSDIFHTLTNGESAVVPVSPEATSWLISVDRAAQNLVHALQFETEVMPPTRAVTLPALRVAMRDLVANIARHAGTSAGTVRYKPDHDLESVFGAYPPLATEVAEALGFASDGELSTLVATVLAAL